MADEERTYTAEDLERMSGAEVSQLLMSASKISVTAVVRRADGSIKYDDPSLAGTYNEHLLEERRHD